LTPEDFPTARERFASRNKSMGATIGQMQRFLQQVYGVVLVTKPATRVESELLRYTDYLQGVRGFARQTIAGNRSCVAAFLKFIGFERSQSAIATLELPQIEAFLRSQAKTCSRHSLRYVVWCLRGFLRFHHTVGTFPRPLHTMIDRARVYRLEQLPSALPWPQVQALLRSIDRREPHGLRDYTVLFLMAAYGLRRSEVVSLTLDDIDWQTGVLRVPQRKTRQHLILPLTDGAGDCLQHYLRNGRPPTPQRELFLRLLAPVAPLTPGAVNNILKDRVRRSGLELLLRIEDTKFHKSRLVPLSTSVAGELRDYLDLCRQKHLSMEPERFLIWNLGCPEAQTRRTCNAFNRTWWRLCLTVGVVDQQGRPPRIHDLRHSAAVAALERWYAQGQDVQSKLQQLATYLGHVTPTFTHHYLHLTPKLREAASQRFHQRFAPLFKNGGRV